MKQSKIAFVHFPYPYLCNKQYKVPFHQNQQYLFMAWYDHLIMLLENMKGSNNQPGECSRAIWDVKLFEQQSLIPTTWQQSTVLQLVDWHAPLRDHIYHTIFRSHICLCWMMWIYCVFSNNYLISILGSKAHLASEEYRDLQPPLICFPTLTCHKKAELYRLITFMLSCHSAAKSIMLFLDPSVSHWNEGQCYQI